MIHTVRPSAELLAQSAHVVIADCDPVEATALARAFVDDGLSVTVVSGGAELLELLCRPDVGANHVDAVVTCALLPDMDGLEVLGMLDGARHAPFVVLTETPTEREIALALGAIVTDSPADVESVRVGVRCVLA